MSLTEIIVIFPSIDLPWNREENRSNEDANEDPSRAGLTAPSWSQKWPTDGDVSFKRQRHHDPHHRSVEYLIAYMIWFWDLSDPALAPFS